MSQNESIDYKALMLSSLKGLTAAAATSVVLSLIASAVMTALPDPASYISPLAYATLLLSFVMGGIFSSMGSENPMLSPLLYSAVHLLIVFCTLILCDGGDQTGVYIRVLLYLAAVCCSLLSSYILQKKSTGKRRTMSRSKKYRT